jgi:hypothetical protein
LGSSKDQQRTSPGGALLKSKVWVLLKVEKAARPILNPMSDTNLPPENVIHLKKRSPAERAAYVRGFRAGLEAAKHGIERSIEQLDDALIFSRGK